MDLDYEAISLDQFDSIEVKESCPRIERVPASPALEGHIISKHLYLIKLHYARGHSRICGGPQNCEFCKTHRMDPYLLMGYWLRNPRRTIWLQLPLKAGKAIMFACKVLQRPIFGTFVRVSREWNGTNAPVRVNVDPGEQQEIRLPSPILPDVAIERTFYSPKVTGKQLKKAV